MELLILCEIIDANFVIRQLPRCTESDTINDKKKDEISEPENTAHQM